ncbi:hypothetical protein ACWEPH_03255 [Nocardia beijingensis]|uniref:hypothetical protein n=1 Tax=Nocardia beijingensis TaxID=95162 RepID=UPI001894BA3B|nr:hypothetical protein [Nocardia beijingensis]MBF6076572.1 hypothetical protein [Nocardia beijingensis]
MSNTIAVIVNALTLFLDVIGLLLYALENSVRVLRRLDIGASAWPDSGSAWVRRSVTPRTVILAQVGHSQCGFGVPVGMSSARPLESIK